MKFDHHNSSFYAHDIVDLLMLMILMPLDFDLVRNWVSYAELKFWLQLCFGSIRFTQWELGLINVRSVFYVARRFQWYRIRMILEKLLLHRCRTHRGRRWKPPSSAVCKNGLGFTCTALLPSRTEFESVPRHFNFHSFPFPCWNDVFQLKRASNLAILCSIPCVAPFNFHLFPFH